MTETGTAQQWLESLYDPLYVVDCERRIVFWNEAAQHLTGYRSDEVVGRFCYDNLLGHVDLMGCELCTTSCPLHRTLADGQRRHAIVYLRHKEGHRVPVHVRIAPVRSADGRIVAATELFSDRSHDTDFIRELESHKKESMLDPLLGINNRRYAEVMFEALAAAWRATGRTFACLMIDLDAFKEINDKWSHTAGDQLLKAIAQTLSSTLRGPDTLVRWGGDEFVVFAPDVATQADLQALGERIIRLVAATDVQLDAGTSLRVTASVGATFFRPDDTLASLVHRVDGLMYLSKSHGGNRCTVG